MKITVTNPNNGRRWRLRPYSNGLCLLIEKSPISKVNPKNGVPVKSEFVSCDKYPSDWADGLRMMMRMMLNDPDDPGDLEIGDPSGAADAVRETFEKWLSEATAEKEGN